MELIEDNKITINLDSVQNYIKQKTKDDDLFFVNNNKKKVRNKGI